MEIRHLRALVAVSEHGSFSAAADSLGTVQSNISAHVARLEKELGTALVDRSAGKLTAEGDVVAARAYRILGEIDAVSADLGELRQEVGGTVRIGMIGTTAAGHLLTIVEFGFQPSVLDVAHDFCWVDHYRTKQKTKFRQVLLQKRLRVVIRRS